MDNCEMPFCAKLIKFSIFPKQNYEHKQTEMNRDYDTFMSQILVHLHHI